MILTNFLKSGKTHIFSHEIAGLLHITSVQVRRDIMLVGYTGTLKKGYEVKGLIDLISDLIDIEEGHKIALIGIGNLGRAIINYLSAESTTMAVVATFDVNPDKINKKFAGIPCYDISNLAEIIKKENICNYLSMID